jgi:hypothetical protein
LAIISPHKFRHAALALLRIAIPRAWSFYSAQSTRSCFLRIDSKKRE